MALRQPSLSLLGAATEWTALRREFRWPRWRRFNIAEACCDGWARREPDRAAVRQLLPGGVLREHTYAQLARASRRLANVLAAHGVGAGDRVAILLPQTPEVAIAHLAAHRMGAVTVPLFTLFGEDGLSYRLRDSGARALVTDADNLPKIEAIRGDLPELRSVLSIDGPARGATGFWREIGEASDVFTNHPTGPDDPALICYTSGTTGPPKGALHAHRVLLGHLPGVELSHERLGRPGDQIWTPADWAWMGGLTNVLLPGLCMGTPVVAHRAPKFDPEAAAAMIRDLGIRNLFMPPTALKIMRGAGVTGLAGVRTVASAGEALGAEMLDWGASVFGRQINEFYGQTECNVVVTNCAAMMPVRPGSAGRAAPGHLVAIVDSEGAALGPGERGEIAVRRPDPVMFLRYWNAPEKTAEKFAGDWMRTGDEASMDEEGYVWFSARADDVITSSGYRIGPTEIEDCLMGDPAVALAAAVGVPDPIRTEAVRAFVVAATGADREGLADRLIRRVRERLSPHVAPREIVFVESLPMTATGKIRRRILRDGR